MPLSNSQATFLGFVVESVCYGIYTIVFGTSIAFMTWRRKTKSQTISKVLLFATCLLFLLGTVHFALEFDNAYRTLMINPETRDPLGTETHQLFGADTIFFTTDFVANLVMIYRLGLVWGGNWLIVILPLLLAFGAYSCSISTLALLLTIDPKAPIAPAAIVPLGTAGLSMSLVVNFLVTLLIIARIWYMDRGTGQIFGRTRMMINSVTTMIIETGALFLVAQLCVVILYSLSNPAQAVVVPAALQIYGIAPTLIIVRVGMGMTPEQPTMISQPKMTTLSFRTRTMNTESDDTRNAGSTALELESYKDERSLV
ncbi:hypothetical protein EXIGLDRAFT_716413 [Exidia glandulosa HHB12029]|uniref:Uncharacterized protein n=1 Tax=Exidia glandulosa HHB12029 TaxID=1314781 RepID=A0A165R3P9_EXIGL|nr:hypothetical protein EXIGLDRAFT_716413 [Exidia glandulosa HHB12029]